MAVRLELRNAAMSREPKPVRKLRLGKSMLVAESLQLLPKQLSHAPPPGEP